MKTAAMSPSAVARRREELYGSSRLKNAETLKENLTTDHLAMISREAITKTELPAWQSTSKMNFKVRMFTPPHTYEVQLL